MIKIRNKYLFVFAVVALVFGIGLLWSGNNTPKNQMTGPDVNKNLISGQFDESKFKSEDEWRRILTREQYYILREKGTERPFSGELNKENRAGTYFSAGCDLPLFSSD